MRRTRCCNSEIVAACSLLALLAFTGCNDRSVRRVPESVTFDADGAALPATWWCDFALVSGSVNGSAPLTFLLDTGAVNTLIERKTASQWPEALFETSTRSRASDGAAVTFEEGVRISELILGPVRIEDFDGVALDLSEVSDALGRPLDGVLPISLFRSCLVTLDGPRREVRVSRGSLPTAKTPGVYQVTGDPRPHVPLDVGGRSIPCLLDSGANGGITLNRTTAEALDYASPLVPAIITIGASGRQDIFQAGRLAGNLRLAGQVLERPVIRTTTGDTRVGVELLREFELTYDLDSRRVRLTRPTGAPIPAEPFRSLGIAFRTNRNPWEVWEFMPFSRAGTAGLRVGDRVSAIQGVPVSELGCDGLAELCRNRDSLVVTRAGPPAEDLEVPVVEVVP